VTHQIDLFRVRMAPEAREAVARVLTPDEQGRLYVGQGSLCEQFERQFGEYLGTYPLQYAPLLLNSCTSAIDLALHLSGVGPGDEVITTPITCTATNSPPALRGARLVWADVDPLTGNIDPADVARKVTDRTKAIIAVNWGGRRCEYDALRRHGVPVIEDAAHGPYGGDGGEYVCYSFQAIKHLTTGDGGALITHGHEHRRAKLLRWYGLDRESGADFRCAQNIREIGYKYQSNDIAAAIGLANLPGMAAAVRAGQDNAAYYARWLSDAPGVDVPPYDPTCSYWLFTLLVEDRADFMAYLAERGIATSQVHARNDAHDAFWAASESRGPLPGVDRFDARQVSIPVGWWVSREQREYIAGIIRQWATKRARRGVAA
jgi:dTDP-4-amino-4,6-dideoxygalactose transaminase